MSPDIQQEIIDAVYEWHAALLHVTDCFIGNYREYRYGARDASETVKRKRHALMVLLNKHKPEEEII